MLRDLPRGPVVAFAVAEIVLPFPLIAAGEQVVPSSLAAILIATLPLIIALLALRFDHSERVAGLRLVGLFVGLGGVALLLGVAVAAARMQDVHPLGPLAVALAVATVLLAPAAVLAPPSSALAGRAWMSLVVLGIVCTALAFLLYFSLIQEVGPSRASLITYVHPVVAVALGVAFLGESVTAAAVAGLLLILLGSWMANGGGPPGRRAQATLGRMSVLRRSVSRSTSQASRTWARPARPMAARSSTGSASTSASAAASASG